MKAHPEIVAIRAAQSRHCRAFLEALSDLDAIVLVVFLPANRASYLRDILLRKSRMPVVVATHGELLHHGAAEIIELTGASPAKRLASSQ